MKKECRIKFFPISFFSMIMGLSGLTIATQKLEAILKLNFIFSSYLLYFTFALFITLSIIYLLKIFLFNESVLKEFNNQTKLSFFPTFSISLLLLAIAFSPTNSPLSKYLWFSGSIVHLFFTLKIISIWIQSDKFKITHMSPAWFIPAVGNILVPVVGVKYFFPELSWFFFSIGLIFWLILLIIFFNRIIFHKPLSEKLLPTLFILIAPPAVGFISLVKLIGEITVFSKILFYFSLFLVLLLFSQFKMFFKVKYYLSWWAYLFPIASITIASALMFHETHLIFFKNLFIFLFVLLIIIALILSIKTIQAILEKRICIEEE